MNRRNVCWALIVGMAMGAGMCFAQDASSKPRAKKDPPAAGKPSDWRTERPARDGEGRGAMKSRRDDFGGPPFGPPQRLPEGEKDGGPWKPGEEGFEGRPPMSPGGADRNRMPLGPGQGNPFSNRFMPVGPPRWPHEDWGSMEKNDPEMFQLLKADMDFERQTREQAVQYARAPKDQRDKIRQHVQELVEKHFDVRQQRRSLELKRLEDELKRLRESMERREKARKDLVEKRVTELLGSGDDVSF